MALSAEQLETSIDNLTLSIASGTLRAKDADGKEHWYRSVPHMVEAKKLLEGQLNRLNNPTKSGLRRALNIYNKGVQ